MAIPTQVGELHCPRTREGKFAAWRDDVLKKVRHPDKTANAHCHTYLGYFYVLLYGYGTLDSYTLK
jgi:hypothetical protein